MKILIYHHNDNDGYLSAAIAKMYFDSPYKDIEFRVGHYDGNDDEEAVANADKVYVLDYRLPPAMMDKYYDKIVWIDHHKTAIEQMDSLITAKNRPLDGKREIGKSGCLLTWEYFFNVKGVPLVVDLVNDRDTWAWKYGEDTAAFHEATAAILPYYEEWIKLLNSDELTKIQLELGRKLLRHICGIVDSYNGAFAWEGNFEGYPVVFLNGSGIISGELHKRLRMAHPHCWFAVIFIFIQDKVRVGLYRTDGMTVDLGKIALKYGGGGHEGASGFYTTHEEWIQVIRESTSVPSGYRRSA